MLRLLLVAVAGLASFFVFLLLGALVPVGREVTPTVAVVLGFLVVPALLLHRWQPPAPGARCPGGKGLYPECLVIVTMTETEFRVTRPKGQPDEVLPIADLREVQLLTNDHGPFSADVWWVLIGREPHLGCSFPQGATGEAAVLAFVQQLPGFRNDAFLQAMGSTQNARFTCWRAEAGSEATPSSP